MKNTIDIIKPLLANKKVIAYGAGVTGLVFLAEAEKKGVEVAYICDGNLKKQGMTLFNKEIRSPYELYYEDKEKTVIVLCSPGGKDVITENLLKMGFSDGAVITEYCKRDAVDHADVFLGVSRGDSTVIDMCAGVKNDAEKILVLGGSTSDPTYDGLKPWSSFFQQMLTSNGHNYRVLNGAVVGYTSSQELLCLMRDGLRLNPAIVISYTGYNDYAPSMDLLSGGRYPLVGRNLHDYHEKLRKNYKQGEETLPAMYYGRLTDDFFGSFIQNIRCMHAVCNEYNILYYAILQPMIRNHRIEPDSVASRLVKEELIRECINRFDSFYEEYGRLSDQYPYLHDFTNIFRDEEDVFYDTCHVYERGNEIIAKEIYRLLLTDGALT